MRKIQLILFTIFSLTGFSQEYRHAIGLRGGLDNGIMFQACMDPENSFKAILGFRQAGVQVAVMRQYYNPFAIRANDRWSVFYGYGMHVGFIRDLRPRSIVNLDANEPYYYGSSFSPVIGLDANLGLEYALKKIPFALSLDYKPLIDIIRFDRLLPMYADLGMTIKYTFYKK